MTPSVALAPQYLDHTKLAFTLDEQRERERLIQTLAQDALTHQFAAVCVRPQDVMTARQALGYPCTVELAAVVGFPQEKRTLAEERAYPTIGAPPTVEKLQEISQCLSEGATELDVVMNVAQFIRDCEEGTTATRDELVALKGATEDDVPIKLILEVDLLTAEQREAAIALAVNTGMAMVKTSTGFLTDGQGATLAVVTAMHQTLEALGVAGQVGLKASGGISTPQQALALIEAGATRLGSSRCVALIRPC